MPHPSSRSNPLTVLTGILVGILLFAALAHWTAGFRPEDAGLGKNTTSTSASFDGRTISGHAGRLQLQPLLESFGAFRREGRSVALWLGASQLHAINQIQPDDQLAVFIANESARARGSSLRYLLVSDPNANLNELLAVYLRFREQRLLPNVLVLAFTYDDLREPGVRTSVVEFLPRRLDLELSHRAGLENLATARTLAAESSRRVVNTLDAMEGTPQERLENALTAGLEKIWRAYANRGQLASWLEISLLRVAYTLRSQATRQRVPPVPEDQEQWNLAALDTLLELARRDQVPVLVYRAPHRPGMRPFYHDRASYDGFFARLSSVLARRGVHYVDLETIVPAELWGETNDGNPDVFHFRGRGHRILGSRVDSVLADLGF